MSYLTTIYIKCENCGATEEVDDEYVLEFHGYDKHWCENCLNGLAFCGTCEKRFNHEEEGICCEFILEEYACDSCVELAHQDMAENTKQGIPEEYHELFDEDGDCSQCGHVYDEQPKKPDMLFTKLAMMA